jgi:DNA-binding MarR family transcriptional regulator
MVNISLTQKEKNTFYGLVRSPNLNDRALAELLDEKMSTVTSIRRRLRERGYYKKIRIPQFQNLDAEIMCVAHGSFKPVTPYGTEVLTKISEEVPATFFGLSNPYHFVMLGVSNCYTDARFTYDGYYKNAKFLKAIDENDLNFSYLPFSMTNIINFFDFAPLLKQLFEIGKDLKVKAKKSPPPNEVSLTPTERKVFLGLVKYPELADKALAEKIKVSRQAASKMRKKFESDGLLRTAIIPNLAQLSLGMIIFTHYSVNPKKAVSLQEKGIVSVKEEMPNFFACSTPYEYYGLSAFTTYQEYERVSEKFFKMYSENKVLLRNPVMIPFSIEDLTYFRNHTYSKILKCMLEK